MTDLKTLLFFGLGLALVLYVITVCRGGVVVPTPLQAAIGFVIAFLDRPGIGLYAPCVILVSLLGMNPTAAFPIMMGSCALLTPVRSVRFVRARAYHVQAALGLALGAVPAVLIAALLVKSLPLTAVRWLVVVLVFYTAINMLLTAKGEESVRGAGA